MDVSLSTTQTANAIRSGQVSSTEVLAMYLAQIDERNPVLNAVISLDTERALARARAADDALARGEVWGPLHGVPFTLKDAHAAAGLRTTVGFPPFADHVPDEDSTVTARLKAAGGIIVGRTNVAMMLADPGQTDNPLFGRTNNPWNIDRTPGGSSGGAAAAVAAGMTPFEIGTDLSGSIRVPAHFCGIFGLKPTEHRVSLDGVVPNPQDWPRSVRIMSCIGPMARSADDLALLYRIIAGPDQRDTDVYPVPIETVPELTLPNLRFAVASTFPGIPVARDIHGAIAAISREISLLGGVVEEAALPDVDVGQDLVRAGELIGTMIDVFQSDTNEPASTLAQYLEALHWRDRSILAWEEFFRACDILLCPASVVTAFPHCEAGTPLQVDGKDVSYWTVSAHTAPFNYTGHPALVLPYTRDRDGMPIGIQAVGKRWDESRLLAAAESISALAGGFQRPPGY
jgi:amidase